MVIERPDFIESGWLVMEPDNWHMKDGAPNYLKEELKNFLSTINTNFYNLGTSDSGVSDER